MTNFKTVKRAKFCTPMDVRKLNKLFNRVIEEAAGKVRQDVSDDEIELFIDDADAVVRAYLAGFYSEADLSGETPYYAGPVSNERNAHTIRLRGVTVAATAITEQWLIEFTGDQSASGDVFTLTGTFSGAQGTGNTATDFTATNLDITIDNADWVRGIKDTDNVSKGDTISFSTYITHPVIRMISTKLAASYLLDSLYGQAESDESRVAAAYRKEGMKILEKLADPDDRMTLSSSDQASAYEGVGYDVNEYGEDVTPYLSITNDRLPYRGGSSFESGL